MQDEERINENATIGSKESNTTFKYGNSRQTLKSDNIRTVFRHVYGHEIHLIGYSRTADARWWNEYFVPYKRDELTPLFQKRIVEELEEGCILIVRNYHITDSEIERRQQQERHQIEVLAERELLPIRETKKDFEKRIQLKREVEETESQREKRLQRQRDYYARMMADPEKAARHRAGRRAYMRIRNGTPPDLPYQTKRLGRAAIEQHLRDNYGTLPHEAATAAPTDAAPTAEERIAELMKKDEEGILTLNEQLELEALLDEGESGTGEEDVRLPDEVTGEDSNPGESV